MRNIEYKARCADLALVEQRARDYGARRAGVLHQRDTYFPAPQGRLKLREQPERPAELIAYERADTARARPSDYLIFRTDDADGLRSALTAALGVRLVVEKERTLYLWRNTRIHLDRVRGLGDFVELETVLSGQSDEEGQAELEEIAAALGIEPQDIEPRGYVDLLVESSSP